MDIVNCILLIVVILLLFIILMKVLFSKKKSISESDINEVKMVVENVLSTREKTLENSINFNVSSYFIKIEEKIKNIESQLDKLNRENIENYKQIADIINKNQLEIVNFNNAGNDRLLNIIKENLKDFSSLITEKMVDIKNTTESNLLEIKKGVDEKLEKTLENRLKQSFDNVITQISSVDKAIGEIKGIANDVGSLKNVLTNVKTKGIVGEVILGNLIKDVLTIDQYKENVVTKKNSSERVEFAVKMPGNDDGYVYLPIDSKFPLESYYRIKEGVEKADSLLVESARKDLKKSIKSFAKDISDKYIDVPNTTDFAIMFLPIEGLYIEALEMGLFEEIQKDYKVNIVGPSTLSALLNALQMGFKSYVIQKRSGEVFNLLAAVKTEFERFAEVLSRTQKKFDEANDELDKLVGTRTRKIQSKLKSISTIDVDKAEEMLEITD